MLKASIKELNHLLGNIDIYLLDQVLKARFTKDHRILDCGCGEGRNLIYFVRHDYQVYGIDKDAGAIQMLKYLIKSINRNYPQSRFVAGQVEQLPYESGYFDAVISSAVLHFAENEMHFRAMFKEHSRVLRQDGFLFVRMATKIGIESQLEKAGDGKYVLPDGSLRFLLTRDLLEEIMNEYELLEPFKTVLVENQRSMCTLVLKKQKH